MIIKVEPSRRHDRATTLTAGGIDEMKSEVQHHENGCMIAFTSKTQNTIKLINVKQ
jgi:hypothetical protein